MCGPAVGALQTDSFDDAVVSGQTWPNDDEVEVGAPDKRKEKDVVRFCGIKHRQYSINHILSVVPSATSSTTTVSFSSAKNNQGRQEEELCGTQLLWIHC